MAKGWPGLAKECKEICEELKIEDINTTNMVKSAYKRLIQSAIRARDEVLIREQAGDKMKCKEIMKENYGKKAYLDNKKIEDVRFRFRSRVGLLPFAGNFSNDRKYAKSNWLCRCGKKENESHIKDGTCPIYNDIWKEYDNLNNDEDLVHFFAVVLERRSQLETLEMNEDVPGDE